MSEVGTLKELGVKPGDVVECVYEPSRAFIGIHMTINKNGCAEWSDGEFMPEYDDEYNRKFRIISRADMPVNYNDGKWHGWNGGECPVHPETVVCAVLLDKTNSTTPVDFYSQEEVEAEVISDGCWKFHLGHRQVIAFRVIKEYKEPREITIDGVTYREVIE